MNYNVVHSYIRLKTIVQKMLPQVEGHVSLLALKKPVHQQAIHDHVWLH